MDFETLLELFAKYQTEKAYLPPVNTGGKFIRGDGRYTFEEAQERSNSARQELEAALNHYIDDRVLQILKSLNR